MQELEPYNKKLEGPSEHNLFNRGAKFLTKNLDLVYLNSTTFNLAFHISWSHYLCPLTLKSNSVIEKKMGKMTNIGLYFSKTSYMLYNHKKARC